MAPHQRKRRMPISRNGSDQDKDPIAKTGKQAESSSLKEERALGSLAHTKKTYQHLIAHKFPRKFRPLAAARNASEKTSSSLAPKRVAIDVHPAVPSSLAKKKTMLPLEDISSADSTGLPGSIGKAARNSLSQGNKEKGSSPKGTANQKEPERKVPDGVIDYDKRCRGKHDLVAEYAMDIFDYMKSREKDFLIEYCIGNVMQMSMLQRLRAPLVDWMVNIQQKYHLDHETLYLAVKLVDIFLGKQIILYDNLPVLVALALRISYKFDKRSKQSPAIKYLCTIGGPFSPSQLIRMEFAFLKTVGFDLAIPLSYRFLRRYARCAGVSASTLLLAKFILEYSLMDFKTIKFSDSKKACAALFMAMRMRRVENPWTPTLEYYTGRELKDFAYMVCVLNLGLHQEPVDNIQEIRKKYSHKTFLEVAKTPLMTNRELFDTTNINQ